MTVTVSNVITTEIELDLDDFESDTDSDLIEQAIMRLYDHATCVCADVNVEVLTIAHRHGVIRLEVSGHYTEVNAFTHAWNEE